MFWPGCASKLRVHARAALLAATEESLQKIQVRVAAAKLVGKDKIGVAAGKVVNRYKVSTHFELTITDDSLAFARIQVNIDAQAVVDGLYIIRTSVKAECVDAASCVRTYKALAQVERAVSVNEDDGFEGATDSSLPVGPGGPGMPHRHQFESHAYQRPAQNAALLQPKSWSDLQSDVPHRFAPVARSLSLPATRCFR